MRSPRPGPLAPLVGVLLLAPAAATAQEPVELAASRQLDGVSRLEVDVEYAAGELAIRPADPGRLYEYRLRYDAALFLPVRAWETTAGTGRLELGLDSREDGDRDFDIEYGDLSDIGGLTLGLSRDVPTDLELSVGAAETSLDLGGIALTRFRFRTGASDTRLRFGEPNPVPMAELDLAAGAASFRAERLGNARFRSFRFKGGIGDVTLDFGGRWEGSAKASLAMGVGSLVLRLPREIGVRIHRRTFLTTFDAGGLVKTGDAYVSRNWETAANRLEIELDATLGTVKVDLLP